MFFNLKMNHAVMFFFRSLFDRQKLKGIKNDSPTVD